MGEFSLFQHFKITFARYAVILLSLFTLAVLGNIAYQVHVYQQQTETLIAQSVDAYINRETEKNQMLLLQFIGNEEALSAFPLDRQTDLHAKNILDQGLFGIDLFYLRDDQSTVFFESKFSREDFLAIKSQIQNGTVLEFNGETVLFSRVTIADADAIIGEKMDQHFLDQLQHFLPLSVTDLTLREDQPLSWDQRGFSFVLPGSNATLFLTTQLDIQGYVLQIILLPMLCILIGAIMIYHMFKKEMALINPFIENTRSALVDIGLGQSPQFPNTEVEEANLLYGSVESLFHQLQVKDTQVKQSHLEMIQLLNAAIGANDAYTNGHSQRVEAIASKFGLAIGYQDQDTLTIAARLHDIGKLGIPTDILNKPGKLNNNEFKKIKDHPSKGAEILTRSEFFKATVPLVRHHHEHWDGSGYPDGLSKNAIPVGAQILALADVYDALTTNRPYRKALDHSEALRIIRDESGYTFNPVLADQFISFLLDPTFPDCLHTNKSA